MSKILSNYLRTLKKYVDKVFNFTFYLLENKSKTERPTFWQLLRGVQQKKQLKKVGKNTQLSSALLDQINKVKEFEPKLMLPLQKVESLRFYALNKTNTPELKLLKKVLHPVKRPYHFIFLLSSLRRGGAELELLNLLKSILRNSSKNCLVVYTDFLLAEAPDWLPQHPQLTLIDFHSLHKEAPQIAREQVLTHLITAIRPEHLINCNSFIGWEVFKKYGKGLSQLTKLTAMLFCYDYDGNGNKAGYVVDYFKETIEVLETVLVDNEAFRLELGQVYGLHNTLLNKIITLRQPYNDTLETLPIKAVVDKLSNNSLEKPSILWASRIAKQKRPDLVLKIAHSMPNAIFHVYGAGDLTAYLAPNEKLPTNIILGGKYDSLKEISFTNFSAFLYTAAWDGLPNILIDLSKIGLPIVASNTGGIEELINEDTGWLIRDIDDVKSYVDALQEVLNKPQLVARKLANAQREIEIKHSQSSYDKKLASLTNYMTKQ